MDGYSDEDILAAGGVGPTRPAAPTGPAWSTPPTQQVPPPPLPPTASWVATTTPQRGGPAVPPGWWQASDGNWYPPAAPASPLPPPPVGPWGVVAGYYSPPKSKVGAGLLGIFLGALGVHRFYLGYNGIGLTMLLLTVLSLGILSPIVALWGFIEGIVILTGGIHDSRGQRLS